MGNKDRNRENVAGNVHCCCFIFPSSLIKFDNWIGLREILQDTPRFHGKNTRFLWILKNDHPEVFNVGKAMP